MFADRYRVIGFLGQGGMGAVYRVEDTATKRSAALKLLSALAGDRDVVERFAREVRIMASLTHASLPRVFGAGISGVPYFVSELIEGETLRDYIDKNGSLSAEVTSDIGAKVADALSAAHAHGVIHRDVKPHNVMIGPGGMVHLIDFGVARTTGSDMKSLTETGMMLGTPAYMAPEQFETHRVDERSDVYSLGVVLFEAVTGVQPFKGDTPFSVGRAHISDPPPKPRSVKANIPVYLEQLILRCLEKNPAKRPWSAAELAALLRKPQRLDIRSRRMPNGDRVEEGPIEATH